MFVSVESRRPMADMTAHSLYSIGRRQQQPGWLQWQSGYASCVRALLPVHTPARTLIPTPNDNQVVLGPQQGQHCQGGPLP